MISGRNKVAAQREIARRAAAGDASATQAVAYLRQFGTDVMTLGNTINSAVMNPARTGETINTMVTGAIAEPVAGLAGLLATGVVSPVVGWERGSQAGADTVDMVRGAMTYQPRRQDTRDMMSEIPNTRIGQALAGFEQMGEGVGDAVLESTGSPGAAAISSALFQTAPDILGTKFLPKGKTNLGVGDISDVKGGKQRGIFAGVNADQDLSDYDMDFPITHGSPVGEIDTINKEGLFDGIFGSSGHESEYGGEYQTTFYPRKGKVMGEGDSDVDYHDAIEYLKSEYPGADDDTIDLIYELSAEDRNVFDMETNPLEEFGYDDLGEASWEGQRIRGNIAARQGFDAVAMDDEFGISYLIPHGSKAIKAPKTQQ